MGKTRNIFCIKLENKFLVLLSTIVACVALALYIGLVKGETVVYTHFFYIPVVLAGVWYYRKAVFIALMLGMLYILVTLLSPFPYPITINEFGRVAVLTGVAYIIGFISERKAKEEEVVRKEKKFSGNIIATVSSSLIVLSRDLRIKKANLSFYSILSKLIGNEVKIYYLTVTLRLNILFSHTRMINILLHYAIFSGEYTTPNTPPSP